LDLTALDVLAKNPRYLTRAKSFDTFFSFGPVIVTKDEIADVDELEVITESNGAVFSRDFVKNMKTRPLELVRFPATTRRSIQATSFRPAARRACGLKRVTWWVGVWKA